MRYFEDFAVGDVLSLATRRVERADIVAFAAQYDPQPYHLDERTSATELTTGLSASGWHTCAMFMRMMCDGFLLETRCMGSPGVETLKWRLPVRAGDTLSGTSTVLESRLLRSRPGVGIVRFRHEVINQNGDVAAWMDNPILIGCRPGDRS